MKIILQKDVAKVGKEGEVVTVADGFARNYLFPRSLAIEAAGGALKNLELRQALEERRSEKLLAQATATQAALDGKTLRISAKAGTGERLYGSITSADIADAVKSHFGVALDKRKVQLVDPIKAIGTFHVSVKLHREITVPLTVEIVKA
jgi:large subunit ribosomal protein L9